LFSEKLKIEQPFATKFFEAALSSSNGKLSHAYMFTGSDSMAQYNLAMRIAKILNCKSFCHCEQSEAIHKPLMNEWIAFPTSLRSSGQALQSPRNDDNDCTCTNCNWIKQNRHPAVITISPIDYCYGNEGGKPKTEITIAQSRYLKQAISTASQYHRVIIFTDAEEGKEQESKAASFWKNYEGELTHPYTDMSEDARESWIPKPLTTKIFDSAPANALLKTIEEPSGKITFFFLTKDKEDMIETIVSRTQAIPVLSQNRETPDLSILENFFKVFPPKNPAEAIAYSERLLEVAKENSCAEEALLIIMQEYMRRLLKANAENKAVSEKIIGNIQKIQQAQDEIANYVNTQAVFDSLMIGLI